MAKNERRAMRRKASNMIEHDFLVESPVNQKSNSNEYLSNSSTERSRSPFESGVQYFVDDNEDSYELCDSAESEEDENIVQNYDIEQCSMSTKREKLAKWAVETKQTRESVNSLLKILREDDPSLPKDRRTLCETPRLSKIVEMDNGHYLHIGLEKILTQFINQHVHLLDADIFIDINIDGVPLTKSSSSCLWPILINVVSFNNVLCVGTFFGTEKPRNINNYLGYFVTEFNQLHMSGLEVLSKKYKLHIRAIIADAPARAFLMNIHSFSGYNSCHKCHIKGKYCLNRVTFPGTNYRCRTDAEFHSKEYVDHFLDCAPTAIEQLPIDCVKNVAVDYMHAVLEGVVKQIMVQWIQVRRKPYSLSRCNIDVLSNNIIIVGSQLPSEFSRTPRPVEYLKRFKGTEFRQLILYTLPIVTLNLLEASVYEHLLKLHCAIRILCSKTMFLSHNNFASSLITSFVNDFNEVYDDHYLTFNLHSLLHLCNDVIFFNSPLDDFSSFKFENFLQFLKKLLNPKIIPYNKLIIVMLKELCLMLIQIFKIERFLAKKIRMEPTNTYFLMILNFLMYIQITIVSI